MINEKPPLVLPREAIAYFRARGYAIGFDWRDIWQEEQARAFTVAKAMTIDLLQDLRAAVDTALTEGQSLGSFKKGLTDLLQRKGWWGKKLMTDPLTGEERVVQLGSPARLRTIYQTNMRTAHAAGAWQRIQRTKRAFPYLRYTSVMDGREREQHHAWHDVVLPVDDPWWDTHYPPCDWGCRCTALAFNQRLLDRRKLAVTTNPPKFKQRNYVNKRSGEITRVEAGIGPGWAYNVGKAPLDGHMPGLISRAAAGDFKGEDDVAGAALLESDKTGLSPFLEPFGLTTRAAMLAGTIWRDASGWPVAIGAGLFRGGDGVVRVPRRAHELGHVAAILRDPDEIRLVWVRDKRGNANLMRRYIRHGKGDARGGPNVSGMVDMGRVGWRYVRAGAAAVARFRTGVLVWSRDEGEVAAYDPSQPRDEAGKWTSSPGFPVATAISEPLSGDEHHAIERYTGSGYENMNRTARGQPLEVETDDDIELLIAGLDQAIAKGTIKENVRLYRGYSGDGVAHLEAASLSVGSIYSDAGFLSTSKDWVAADRFAGGRDDRGVLFIIHAKAGIPALDISRASSVGTGEHEVVFPRNAKFKVKSIDYTQATIEVETIK